MLRSATVFSLLTVLLLICSSNLSAELPDFTMYPKTVIHRWNFVTIDSDSARGQVGEDFKEIDDLFSYENYPWNDAKTELLRRFDIIACGAVHVMSFTESSPDSDKYMVYGDSLNHVFFDTRYDHDAHNGGSQQSLLGKSKIKAERVNAVGDSLDQITFGSAGIFKIEQGYLKNRHNLTNPDEESIKRELSDWVSPGWFALGAGAYLLEPLAADTLDTLIYIEDYSNWIKYVHNCAGDYTDPDCTAPNIYSGSQDNVWRYTFITILPEDFDLDYTDSLESCFDDPEYEIMKVDLLSRHDDDGNLRFRVERACRGSLLAHSADSQVRPLVWTNPNKWGSIAFIMDLCTCAPQAVINDSGPFNWYDMGAAWVANHHLKSHVTITNSQSQPQDSFYLCDGIWLDGYWPEPYEMQNQPKMFLHSEDIDLNCDNTVDQPAIEDTLTVLWKNGYSEYLEQIRDYTQIVRNDSTAFIILTNGTPDTSHYRYINGKVWEDTNGWFQDQDASWFEVVATTESLSTDQRIVEPRYLIFTERDPAFDEYTETNLSKMRLTLAHSLLFTDYGYFCTTGRWTSRSPVFEPDRYEIEDYYDEYAVEDSCYGMWSDAVPKDTIPYPDSSSEDSVVVMDRDTLFTATHYLGAPIDTLKIYYPHSYDCGEETCYDLLYREFDHGVVFVHYGACVSGDSIGGMFGMMGGAPRLEWVYMDSISLEDDPWLNGYHFIGIGGCEIDGYENWWNDTANMRQHPVDSLWLYTAGDGRIILKEGDGFEPLHDPIKE